MPNLPAPYERFVSAQPTVAKAYDDLARACHGAGPLDEKTRQLIKLGIAIGQQSEGSTKSHARQALEAGVTREQVRHAVLLTLTTTGFPAMIAAREWVEEVIATASK